LKTKEITDYIVNWLDDYLSKANMNGFVIGISGGIDSAVTSTLCALTNRKVILVNMPIKQSKSEFERGNNHIKFLKENYLNCSSVEVDLNETFESFMNTISDGIKNHHLAMANSRARLRMTSLYAVAQYNNCLVVGTGNKIEDFGIGFFTKYGDGGVDLSPIADLLKSEVFKLGKELEIIKEIQNAKPTDGLWGDNRTDEDQIGASYNELEWAMNYKGNLEGLSDRENEVLTIYKNLNRVNQHKMIQIPVCTLPNSLRS
jgi:NAD+ synthase